VHSDTVTPAIEIHRSERKAGFIESTTGLLEAAVTGAILNRE